MPLLEYFLVCRSIQNDISTNEMSFINILEDVTPDTFPHVIPKAIAVSLWNFERGEEAKDWQATLVVKIPGKDDARFAMNLSHGAHRCRAVQGVLEIPVDGPCDITFEALLNGTHAASHTVKVHPAEARAGGEGGKQLLAAD